MVEALPATTKVAIATESQARELAKVAPADRAGVVQAVVDSGKPVTAAEIKKRIPPVPVKPSTPATASPALPPPPAPVVDGTGWPVPTQLIPLWRRGDEAQVHFAFPVNLVHDGRPYRLLQEHRDKSVPGIEHIYRGQFSYRPQFCSPGLLIGYRYTATFFWSIVRLGTAV